MVTIIRPRVDYMSRIKVASGALALIDFRLASENLSFYLRSPSSRYECRKASIFFGGLQSLVMRIIGCVGYTQATGRSRSI